MNYVIGVDAGNSKTFALVANDAGRVLGFGRAGPGNHQTVGLQAAIQEIQKACEEALTTARVVKPVSYGVFGLAGADLPEDFELLQEAMKRLGIARLIRVENDTIVALRAGTSRPWGVVVVCGAGFNAAGIAPDGRILRLPGLGWISGDWGGGLELAREAVRCVARAWDGRGNQTLLTPLVLNALGVESVEEMISGLYHGCIEEKKLLDIVPCIFEAANFGDVVAQELIIRLGREVGTTASAIITRLGLEELDVEVVLAGGVFRGKGSLLLDTIAQVLHRTAPKARLVRPKYEPVVGAIIIALEAIKGCLSTRELENLEKSLPEELKN